MAKDVSLTGKAVVLVGLMGAGKTSVGRKLAAQLGRPFLDADEEIVAVSGCSIQDIFDVYGEAAFRDVEQRVIARLLKEGEIVLATGGGAFMSEETRSLIGTHGVSVWLRATLDVLDKRTRRRSGRPLLKGKDSRKTLKRLIDERYPVYETADIIVDSDEESIETMTDKIIGALADYTGATLQETTS